HIIFLFLQRHLRTSHLDSFPTRRSSDLSGWAARGSKTRRQSSYGRENDMGSSLSARARLRVQEASETLSVMWMTRLRATLRTLARNGYGWRKQVGCSGERFKTGQGPHVTRPG